MFYLEIPLCKGVRDLVIYRHNAKDFRMRIESSGFRFQTFVTVVVLLSFLAVVISGVALYLRPEDSLARWVGWKFAGWDKKQWEAAHTGVVILFLISSLSNTPTC
jgi:hypothetical protein